MGTEIERKFLLVGNNWKKLARGIVYRQGYLHSSRERTVRVRIAGNRGFLTIKGGGVGISRMEFEYQIPVEDAEIILEKLCEKPFIEKKRYKIEYAGFTWEVDEFFGENDGLTMAEIELTSEEQPFDKPPWVGKEVSGDPRYFNAVLSKFPYTTWDKKKQGAE
ncbi:MAG TPA: CYTH domain-containing protein [Desulfobulbaceae bacterium]|nr:CYTH domain-containing protein [Desulfobulbaceae bacterium]